LGLPEAATLCAKLGSVAYNLDLPKNSSVHPVFHVSQLKKSPVAGPVVSSLPSDLVEFQVPIAILQRRWSEGDHPVEEGLLRWSQMPPSLSTWEPLETLKQQFPRAPAWGHATSQAGEGVSSAQAGEPEVTLGQNSKRADATSSRSKRQHKPNPKTSGPEWLR
jgi:hypothetical protein